MSVRVDPEAILDCGAAAALAAAAAFAVEAGLQAQAVLAGATAVLAGAGALGALRRVASPREMHLPPFEAARLEFSDEVTDPVVMPQTEAPATDAGAAEELRQALSELRRSLR